MLRTPKTLTVLLVVTTGMARTQEVTETMKTTAQAIRTEATRANQGEAGRPLPLACGWCTGSHDWSKGWRPIEQLKLIAAGRHLMPWFAHPSRAGTLQGEAGDGFRAYYEEAIRTAAEAGLPLTFSASQWESALSRDPYYSLPPERNPNVVGVDGKVWKTVSPFGPVEPWRELGRTYTDNALMRKLQEWYPDPPLVIFLSNNEHGKLRWHQAEKSARYVEQYGTGGDAEFRRRVVADGWIERYRALQGGMREGLDSAQWRRAARFVGYGAGPPEFFGRWHGWINYSLHSKGRLMPYPLMWDGGSPSYYTHDWCPTSDHTAWSPQIEFMNTVFMLRDAYEQNPDWWYEMSLWDGHEWPWRKTTPSKVMAYETSGQTWNPTRYQGFIQFGLWLMQPRAVREYRGWTTPWDKAEPYFLALSDVVDRVHADTRLREWWRHSELVPNRTKQHIHRAGIPEEYLDEDRWFLLDCSANPAEFPWELHWRVSVFSLARVRGLAPQRKWLVYAHSPLDDKQGVTVTVPGYGDIAIDVTPGGVFYEIDERKHAVERLTSK